MGRDKSAKFYELANKRVNNAIKNLRLIANLSNRNSYEYTDAQAKKIINALQVEIENIKNRFSEKQASEDKPFSL